MFKARNDNKYDQKEEMFNNPGSNSEELINIIETNIKMLEKILKCPITIIYNGKQLGNQNNTEINQIAKNLNNLEMFKWHGCLGYTITDGVMLFWTSVEKLKKEIDTLSLMAKQIDLIINNYKLSKKLEEMATIDELTKIYNRRSFMEQFRINVDKHKRYGGQFGLILMDIDKFKVYNDSFGHPEGDTLLRSLGVLLKENLRESDVLGRLGGEEFGILVNNIKNREDIKEIAEKVRLLVASELNINKSTAKNNVTISIGCSIHKEDGEDIDTLYKIADERLYESKNNGRNRVTF